jgi:hypothetical protein
MNRFLVATLLGSFRFFSSFNSNVNRPCGAPLLVLGCGEEFPPKNFKIFKALY